MKYHEQEDYSRPKPILKWRVIMAALVSIAVTLSVISGGVVVNGEIMNDLTRVFNGDCVEGMKEFPDKYFQLAICDPPYGFGVNMNMGRRKGKGKKHEDKDWDGSIPGDDYFDELFRVSVNQIIWGGNYFGLPPNKCFIVWDKAEGIYGRDFAEAEYAWASFDESSRIWKKGPNQADRIHPTQKPVSLYKWLIKHYAKPGDLILDTHIGSQSIRMACFDLGYDLTAYELDKDYFEAGNKRFNQHKAQLKLFPA